MQPEKFKRKLRIPRPLRDDKNDFLFREHIKLGPKTPGDPDGDGIPYESMFDHRKHDPQRRKRHPKQKFEFPKEPEGR